MAEQNPFIEIEQSRRLHDLLAGYDAELRELEADPTRYTLSDFDRRFKAIMRLREQVRKAIEEQQNDA